jgi:hypothetical protein
VNSNILFEKEGAASCSVTTAKLLATDLLDIPILLGVKAPTVFDRIAHSSTLLLHLSCRSL